MDDSFALGGDFSLVYIEGAMLNATSNLFRRGGVLDTRVQNFTKVAGIQNVAPYFPLDTKFWSATTWTQGKGAFWLKSSVRDPDELLPLRVEPHSVYPP